MNVKAARKSNSAKGFTLVELVMVVLILGILATIGVSKVAYITAVARTNSAKHTLAAVRNAIELYKGETGSYPADATTLPTILKPYLKGPFPAAPLGANAGSPAVATGEDAATVVSGSAGWAYVPTTGEFYLNDATALAW